MNGIRRTEVAGEATNTLKLLLVPSHKIFTTVINYLDDTNRQVDTLARRYLGKSITVQNNGVLYGRRGIGPNCSKIMGCYASE